MEWKLIKVTDTEWRQDKSGMFTFISYCLDGTVRLDIMADTGLTPVASFQGKAENVRKVAVRWIVEHIRFNYGNECCQGMFSAEHASYIGSELARAELLKTEYVQD